MHSLGSPTAWPWDHAQLGITHCLAMGSCTAWDHPLLGHGIMHSLGSPTAWPWDHTQLGITHCLAMGSSTAWPWDHTQLGITHCLAANQQITLLSIHKVHLGSLYIYISLSLSTHICLWQGHCSLVVCACPHEIMVATTKYSHQNLSLVSDKECAVTAVPSMYKVWFIK